MAGVDELAFSLAAVAARLREIGEGGLVRELQREIGRAVGPVPAQVRAGLAGHLPDRYAAVLDADLRVSRRTFLGAAGDETRVVVLASPVMRKRRLRQSNAGFLWHPVFGDRKRWKVNAAPGHGMVPGWFDDPVEAAAPRVREAARRALDNVTERAVGK